MTAAITCVIPAFEAGATLASVVAGVRASVPAAHVIVVDDGSSDDTAAVATDVADHVIVFGRNRGKGAALRVAFREALHHHADVIVTLDADGQHDPALVPTLVEHLAGYDLVIGQRAQRNSSMPWRRRLMNTLANLAVHAVAGVRLQDTQSGFRAMRRSVVENVHAQGDRYEFETDFLVRALRCGYRVRNTIVPTVYGPPSHFRHVRDSVRIVRTLWGFRPAARATARTS